MKKITDTVFGQTPLPEDYRADLIPSHIETLQELNQLEGLNISKAVKKYLFGKKDWKIERPEVLNQIHKAMFDDVWKWAGKYRDRDLNIGRPKAMIAQEVKVLCDDLNYWIEKKTYSPIEIAVRFHHRLVHIHPYINGNGRHARLVADILVRQFGEKELTWGGGDLVGDGTVRKKYIEALKMADMGEYETLIKFSHS